MTINSIYTSALLGLALSSGIYNEHLLPTTAEHATVAMAAPVAGALRLEEFVSEEGRFRITLPAGFPDPTENVTPMATAGGEVELKMYTSASGNTTAAMFAFANMEGKLEMAGHETAMLDGARDNMLKQMNGTLTKETKITIDGHPGRKLVFSMKAGKGPKFYARLDMYMVPPMMYQVMYVSDRKSSVDSKEIVNFFKSFRLE